MKGLNEAYVESIIRKSKDGKLTAGQAAAKLHQAVREQAEEGLCQKGASAFGHGNKGKAMPWRIGTETEERIVGLSNRSRMRRASICSKYSRAWRSICLDPNQPPNSRVC